MQLEIYNEELGMRTQDLQHLSAHPSICLALSNIRGWHALCSCTGAMTDNEPREDQLQAFETGQDIRDRAFRFACRVVRVRQKLYEGGGVGRVMAPQLLNCSTSVPSMLEEALAAESRRDFVSKCSISLKECRESLVRLRIHEACRIGPSDEAAELRVEATALVSIIGAIIRNTRRNAGLEPGRPMKSRIPNS